MKGEQAVVWTARFVSGVSLPPSVKYQAFKDFNVNLQPFYEGNS